MQIGSYRCHDPCLEQIELGAAVHLAFDGFEAADGAFDLTTRPWHRDGGGYGILVAFDDSSERGELAVGGDGDPRT